jgi:hypothetical protein
MPADCSGRRQCAGISSHHPGTQTLDSKEVDETLSLKTLPCGQEKLSQRLKIFSYADLRQRKAVPTGFN